MQLHIPVKMNKVVDVKMKNAVLKRPVCDVSAVMLQLYSP